MSIAIVHTLPAPLILLIHLHILQYPHENKPEYDHNVFNPRARGLRERTKTMEDVCHFLVSRIESKDGVRKSLPVYPCLQPADTTAFRASLAKYLENLRQSSISPQPASRGTGRGTSATKSSGGSNIAAWWWTDVLVRKSLLEECSGERFERLILALSTHALVKGSVIRLEPHETAVSLRNQPYIYATRLSVFRSSHSSWVRDASLLNQRQHDLQTLRMNILHHGGSKKYSSLSTEKLLALVESKLQDLLTEQWTQPEGYLALKFLIESTGIQKLELLKNSNPQLERNTPAATSADATISRTPPSPLPIAAAHHPTILRKLAVRMFAKAANSPVTLSDRASQPITPKKNEEGALSNQADGDGEARMLQALTDALTRTRKTSTTLNARVTHRASGRQAKTKLKPLKLWQETHAISVNFTANVSEDTFVSLDVSPPGSETDIETRVKELRAALQPAYPTASLSTETTAVQRRSPPNTPRATSHMRIESPQTVKPLARVQPHHHRGAALAPTLVEYSHGRHESQAADPFIDFEGPSLSVHDLLLRADTTQFDIITLDDVSGDLVEQSFEWA